MIGQFQPPGFVCENDVRAYPGGPTRKCALISKVQVIDGIGRRVGPCCSVEAAAMGGEPVSERELALDEREKFLALHPDRVLSGPGSPDVDLGRALRTGERGATRKVGLLGVAD
jgi:hypothetical protein